MSDIPQGMMKTPMAKGAVQEQTDYLFNIYLHLDWVKGHRNGTDAGPSLLGASTVAYNFGRW